MTAESDADDASRRRCALRVSSLVFGGLFGLLSAVRLDRLSRSCRLPSVARDFEKECARGEKPRPLRVGPREREDAPTIRNESLPRTNACALDGDERLRVRWLSPRRESRRRSLDDAREGAARCLIRSLPTFSDSSRCDCGSAPNRLVLVQLASDPPDGRGRSPLPWRGCTRTRLLRDHHLRGSSGQLENCEQRGSRARRLAAPGHRAPSVARRVLDDETAMTPAFRPRSSLVRGG